jgi:hypothetical protein
MSGHRTPYVGLFDGDIRRVIIPRIQRDYAQGREDPEATRVREAFLGVLVGALTGERQESLDFVYGDVSDGAFTPLDGQQRLTTLFLLHWYLAARTARLDPRPRWGNFAYETRPGARTFCERLVEKARPFPLDGALSVWLVDQPWFMGSWNHDPTVQGMLVMLDALHAELGSADAESAWARLTDRDAPAISFYLLDIERMGLTDELYVKMNSRGKPLSAFEHWKALFEEHVDEVAPERARDLAEKLDGSWANLLWPYRNLDGSGGAGDVIDEELLRYFDFLTEVRAWSEGVALGGERMARTKALYAGEAARAGLDWLFLGFDTWHKETIATYFEGLFAPDGHSPGKLTLFGRRSEVDLFAGCCGSYSVEGRRAFSLQRTLLLYAVLVHRIERTEDFPRRLRALRNLLEASQFQVRVEAMPQLVRATRRLMVEGVGTDLAGFSPSQVEEERCKARLLAAHPGLRPTIEELEDHPLLRGTLGVFDLEDPDRLAQRAGTFRELFVEPRFLALTAALLACGDYAQWSPDRRFYYFGARRNAEPWRELFVRNRPGTANTRTALMTLLDRVAAHAAPADDALADIARGWLATREAEGCYDWRTCLVKYPAMREGDSGIYAVAPKAMAYDACMLDKERMYSNYRDPWLHAIRRLSRVGAEVEESLFTGYEHFERWMVLPRSGVALRCTGEGIRLRPPTVEGKADAYATVCAASRVTDHLLEIPTRAGVDTEDRVALGAALLRSLVAAGC